MKLNIKPNKFVFDWKFILYILSVFILLFLMNSCHWTFRNFHRVNFDEIGIVLNSGVSGTDSELLFSFIKKTVLRSFIWSVFIAVVLNFFRQNRKFIILAYIILFGITVETMIESNIQMGSFFNYKKSNFYETEYVDPETAEIKWPKHRNVLFIALESMEKSYGSTEIFDEVLTPNITRLEQQNTSFENYNSVSGLSHTIAAITGFTTGLPLFYTSFRNVDKMVGTYGIGKILTSAGYDTYSIFPATGKFSKKEAFMYRMGFNTVFDGEYIRKNIKNPPKEKPFEGIDDGTLFDWAKKPIAKITKSEKPYFIFMETINTHCKGYLTEYCKNHGFKQENMEDIIKCDDKIIADFVKWFRHQDPNAVVILLNDHPQHTGIIMKKLKQDADRNLQNAFINTDIFDGVDLNRPVSAMDFFPTILESAGAKITGCRLGLGTALSKRCKDVKTLRERFTDKELENKMEQKNNLYYKLATGIEKK